MNCRTFQKNLEDYLQDGLDFAGRFGMERHARQCIRCGREMANAQRLSRLARGLDKVKAPSNFESRLLDEIGKRELRSRFSIFRRFLVFGFDMLSWRRWAPAAAGILVLGLVLVFWQKHEGAGRIQPSYVADVNPMGRFGTDAVETSPDVPATKPSVSAGYPAPDPDSRLFHVPEGKLFIDYQTRESDYREYRAIGPDNLPMIIPLPGKIQMQFNPPPEEYFIRNVSH